MLLVFAHWVWCWLWFCNIWPQLCWHIVPLIPTLLSFYYKWALDFIKCFFCIYWYNHVILIFHFVYVVYHGINLWILFQPCTSGMNPTWSWCMIPSMYCWICFANILSRLLAAMFFKNIGLKLSFFVVYLSCFRARIMLAKWSWESSLKFLE